MAAKKTKIVGAIKAGNGKYHFRVAKLKKVAAGKNASPAQTALAWLLSKPYMGSPIIGATNLDQLTSAAQATEFAITPDESKMLEEPYQFRVSPMN